MPAHSECPESRRAWPYLPPEPLPVNRGPCGRLRSRSSQDGNAGHPRLAPSHPAPPPSTQPGPHPPRSRLKVLVPRVLLPRPGFQRRSLPLKSAPPPQADAALRTSQSVAAVLPAVKPKPEPPVALTKAPCAPRAWSAPEHESRPQSPSQRSAVAHPPRWSTSGTRTPA